MSALAFWVVYDNPKDFPGKFVVRRWVGETATDEHYVEDTLEAVRMRIPDGFFPIHRFPQDQPHIVEVWA